LVAPFESASRSLSHRRSISDVPCRFTDTPVELPLSCFPDRDLRRAPPLGVRPTLAPFRQERTTYPCLGGSRLFAPKRLPSFIGPTRCVPPWCSSAFPLAGVHPKLPYPFHTENPFSCRTTFASTRSWCGPGASPLRPEGLLAEPPASESAGTSCRLLQPTFSVFKHEHPRLARYRFGTELAPFAFPDEALRSRRMSPASADRTRDRGLFVSLRPRRFRPHL
jgi:hypothetical protein